jgi:preprotein translocase subunit SecD
MEVSVKKHLFFAMAFFILVAATAFGQSSIFINRVFQKASSNTVDMKASDDNETFHVSKRPLLVIQDFSDAEPSVDEGSPALNLELTPVGAQKIREFTSKNVGKRLAFIVDGKLIRAPVIRDVITGPGLSIDPVGKDEALRLSKFFHK